MTPDEREDYEERAAILEYEANLSRAEAERQALAMITSAKSLGKMAPSAMSAASVQRASGSPRNVSARFDFWRVFVCVTPMAEAFKVIERVVHVVAVFVMHLTAASFSAAFAGLIGFQPLRSVRSSRSRLRSAFRVQSLGDALAFWATKRAFLEMVARLGSHHGGRVVLPSEMEVDRADGACLRRVLGCHNTVILLQFLHRADNVSSHRRHRMARLPFATVAIQ